MKLDFNWKNDGKYHQYCIHCHAETIDRVIEGGKTHYICQTCGQPADRSIVIDPAVTWWLAEDGEYWHESSGIFIRNPDGKFLFFERLMFPFALTVPAGHVDAGEAAPHAAYREAEEEIGLRLPKLIALPVEDVMGDSCRRGCDAHRWHAYVAPLDESVGLEVTEHEEGAAPVWLTLAEAQLKDLAYPVRYIIERYGRALETKA